MGEERIAEEHAQGVSPARIHRRLAATTFGIVDDVIVDEGGQMDQLDNHRQVHVFVCDPASCSASQKRNQRAQSFAAAFQRITDVTLDRRIERCGLPGDALRNFVQMRLHH